MDNKKSMSQKEKDALKAKREKERRAAAKKKEAEKLAKIKAAEKARKQKQKEKAKHQKEKKKEQQAKERAKAEIKKETKPAEKQSAEPISEAVTDNKTVVSTKPVKAVKKTEKSKKTAETTNKIKGSLKDARHFINEKALLKISAFFKKAFSARYRVISICAIAAILTATAVPVSIFSYRNWLITSVGGDYNYYGIADSKEKEIEISAEQQLERADEMKRHGQKSKFEFFTNTDLDFHKWYSNGKLIFGNVLQNKCDLVVTIFDEDGRTVLYRSDGIKPGYYISEIRLFEQLAPGEYKTRMFVAGYETGSNKLVGVQYVNVTIAVGGE